MELKTVLFAVAAFAGVAVSADSSWSQTQPIDLTNIVVENYAADQFGSFTYSFSYFDPLFYAIGNCSGTGDNSPATCEVGDPLGGEGLIYPSVFAGPLYGSEHDYMFNLTIDANYVSAAQFAYANYTGATVVVYPDFSVSAAVVTPFAYDLDFVASGSYLK